MFLARKISRAKWDAQGNADRGLAEGEISADSVTGDLRTRDDTLSFWRCDTDTDAAVEEAALAIAAAGERLDRLDIVWLAHDELREDGHTLRDTEGRTPVADLTHRHVDVCRLDYVRLGNVARRVAAAIEARRCRRLTRVRVKRLVVTAVEQRRIVLDELADRLRAEVTS